MSTKNKLKKYWRHILAILASAYLKQMEKNRTNYFKRVIYHLNLFLFNKGNFLKDF